jgi:AcrR family transcriptional regulator
MDAQRQLNDGPQITLPRMEAGRFIEPPNRRDDPRYARLMAAARDAAVNGYDAVSMRELAKATHLSLTTIYEFCGSKDQIIAEAHVDGMERLRAQLARRPPWGPTAEARVRSVMRAIVVALERDPVRTMTLMRAFYALAPGVAESRAAVRETHVAMVDAAIGDEKIANRADVIDTLGHVINSAIVEWMRNGDASSAQETLDRAVRVLIGTRNSSTPTDD